MIILEAGLKLLQNFSQADFFLQDYFIVGNMGLDDDKEGRVYFIFFLF